ncbi:hypothetical protein Efla_001772 [Eimeria flavescens]
MARCCLPCVPPLSGAFRSFPLACCPAASRVAAAAVAAAAAAAPARQFLLGGCCCLRASLVSCGAACRAAEACPPYRRGRTRSSSSSSSSSSTCSNSRSGSSSTTDRAEVRGVAVCGSRTTYRCSDADCSTLSGSRSNSSSSSSSSSGGSSRCSRRWGPFFETHSATRSALQWQGAFDLGRGSQPLFAAGFPAAAGAAAAAAISSAPAAALRQPASACRRLMSFSTLGAEQDKQRQLQRQLQQQQLLLLQPQPQQLLLQHSAGSLKLSEALSLGFWFGGRGLCAASPFRPAASSASVLAPLAAREQQQEQGQRQQQQGACGASEQQQEQQALAQRDSSRSSGGGGGEQQQGGGDSQQRDESYMSWKQVWHVFGIAALPMVGFGLMDQLIMIRLGDLLDTTLGVKFGLATLSAAAVGQLCSDTAGVLFGSTIESCANRLGFPPPNLNAAQRASALFSLTKTLGAASGVCCGCLLGMLQLLVLDLDRADRLKHQQQLDTILETVLIDGPKLFHCERAALFVYDASRDEVWSKAIFGGEKAIRMQRQKNKCFITWVFENKAILNCPEASEDPRFNPEFDEKTEHKTRSVLAAPVMNAAGEDDERMVEMMSRHVQIFLEKFEYGAAEDRRMISLPESEHVSQYHAAAGGVSAAASRRSAAAAAARTSSSSSSDGPRDAAAAKARRGAAAAAADCSRQCNSCSNCGSGTACVLLHSLGTSVSDSAAGSGGGAAPAAAAAGRERSSFKKSLLTAAIAAATAAGLETAAADGSPAWWLRWLFCLPDDDDYLLLSRGSFVAAAAAATAGAAAADGRAEETGGDNTSSEAPEEEAPPGAPKDGSSSRGGGESGRPKRVSRPPPYWRATFPHLYTLNRSASARIVEVDRESGDRGRRPACVCWTGELGFSCSGLLQWTQSARQTLSSAAAARDRRRTLPLVGPYLLRPKAVSFRSSSSSSSCFCSRPRRLFYFAAAFAIAVSPGPASAAAAAAGEAADGPRRLPPNPRSIKARPAAHRCLCAFVFLFRSYSR